MVTHSASGAGGHTQRERSRWSHTARAEPVVTHSASGARQAEHAKHVVHSVFINAASAKLAGDHAKEEIRFQATKKTSYNAIVE